MVHDMRRNALRPLLEGLAVDAEAVVMGQGDEICRFPGAVAAVQPLQDGGRLLFEPLGLEDAHPCVKGDLRKTGDGSSAWRIAVFCEQDAVVGGHGGRYVEAHLRHLVSARGVDVGVGRGSHVQDHVVIVRVVVVSVGVPVGRSLMDLHVSHPERAPDLNLGVEEVGTRVGVLQARVDHFDGLARDGHELRQRKELVPPTVLQECFHAFSGGWMIVANVRKNSDRCSVCPR